MSIEEIIRSLENHAELLDQMRRVKGQDEEQGFADTLREAAALLRTPPEAKPNEKNGDGWIKIVDIDTMPRKLVRVLAWKDGEVHLTMRCNAGSWQSMTREDADRYGWYWSEAPSYWMPLPGKPKED